MIPKKFKKIKQKKVNFLNIYALVFGLILSGVVFEAKPVQAATCSITGTTTINQAYIDSGNCSTINIAGTFTVTWSGTTDLVGAGDVNITSGTVTFSGAVVLGSTDSITIAIGATVTHAIADTVGINITAANLTVGGLINTNSKGCAGALATNGYGPNGSNVCTITTSGYGPSASFSSGGGSHGGLGSSGVSRYDSDRTPVLLGSSGGGSTWTMGTTGGNGGGLVRLNISGTLSNTGTISANGGAGENGQNGSYSGGGSGGSVYVTAGTISGAGTITAAGGGGSGPGGGGRVAVYYGTNSGATLTNFTAASGGGTAVNGSTFILDRSTDDGIGTLTITSGLDFQSGGDYSRTNITVSSGSVLTCDSFATLNIGATATFSFTNSTFSCSTIDAVNISAATFTVSGATNVITINKASSVVDWNVTNDLTLTNLTYTGVAAGSSIGTGGVLSMDNAINLTLVNTDILSNINITNLLSVNLDSNSSINANSLGCAGVLAGNGLGPNATTNICTTATTGYGPVGSFTSGGGSYGGLGYSGTATYGSNTAPVHFGSSGGGATWSDGRAGGNGGGLIRLDTTGTFTNAGVISANGGNGAWGNNGSYSSGGSGGSVYITAGSLSGAGTVTAAGGNGGGSNGMGGGGRVAIYYVTNIDFTLGNATAAAGGAGAAAGTVYSLQYTVPTTPSISSPTSGAYNVNVNPTITSSTYVSNGASHTTSDWKITSDVGGSTIVWSKSDDASNLVSIVVNSSNGTFASGTALSNNTLYYAFVRHTNGAGDSSWSSALPFTTIATNNTSTKTWDFGTDSDYTYNGSYVTVTGGLGKLLDLGGGTYSTPAPSALSAWTRRKTITVTENSGSTLTNYQTSITVTYDADMQADFDDIRFTDANNTLLDYWLETKTDSTTATFWVEIPTLTASSANTIYMYYGNSGAASLSNIDNTMLFGDDFSSALDTTTKWTDKYNVSYPSITSGSLNLSSARDAVRAGNYALPTDTVIEASVKKGGTGQIGRLAGVVVADKFKSDVNNGETGWDLVYYSDNNLYYEGSNASASGSQGGAAIPTGYSLNYRRFTVKYQQASRLDFSVDALTPTSLSVPYVPDSADSLYLELNNFSGSMLVDWMFVRKYASTEPSVSTGSELALATYDQVSIVSVVPISQAITLGTFTETRGATGGQGSTYYNISLDGTNWKYWNGSNWAAASTGNYNSASTVNDFLPKFITDTGTGNIYFKAFLLGANQPVEINTLVVTYSSINVSLTAATQSVAENVGTVTVTAQLSTTSGSNVIIPYTVSGTATGGGTDHNLANGNITVTAGATSGNTTFTVTNDSIDENDETVIVTLGTPSYGTLVSPSAQTITITDNDTAGITVGVISGNTTEAGGTATFTIVLNSQPTANVSIGISSNDTTEGTISPSSVTFTSGNWNSTQLITITGVDDSLDDGDIVYSIVTAAATSSDPGYNTMNASDVSVTNTDNDTSGFNISSISGNTSEAGATATFTIALTAQPTANVSIAISSNDTTEGTVSPSSVTFTSGNWSTNQTVTATGLDDDLDDGNIAYSVVLAAATSSDTNYNTLNPNDVSVTNIDGDTAGATISQSNGSTDVSEGGITDTYTLVLTSQPTANVVITVTGNTQVTPTPTSLTFTSANWNTTQTVTATAIRDAVVEGAHTGTITHTATSSDPNYNGVSISSVTANITDNNKPTANAGSDTTIAEATTTTTLSGTSSTDTDGDTMTYAWTETSDSSDACSLTNPTTTQPTVTVLNKESSYDCIYQLIVNDSYINSTADAVTLHVTAVNDAPAIGDLASTVTVSEGSSLTILVAASDTDSSALTLTAQDTTGDFTAHSITVSTLFSQSGNSGTFSWTPNNSLSGDYTIGFQASDGTNTVTESVVITVTNVNQAPIFSDTLPNVSFIAGTTTQTVFDLSEYFSDPDGDALTYTVTGNQDITANISDNGEVTFTADADFVGTEDMSFEATDPDGLTEQSNEIEVNVTESEGETEIDHITGSSRGPGWITVYGTDNQRIARWKAFPKGGVIPRLAEIKNHSYIFAIKKRSGTTIHVYTSDGETLLKKRLSTHLHSRHLAVGNINTTKATEEIVVATKRGGNVYFKVFSFSPTSNAMTLLDTISTYVDSLNFRIDIQRKNVVVIINKKGKLIYSWQPMK